MAYRAGSPTVLGGRFNPAENLSSAEKIFTQVADRIETRAKNKAINELLQVKPTQGNHESSVGQNPLMFQQQQQQALSQIDGMNPLEALNLSTAQAKPYLDDVKYAQQQSNLDRGFAQQQNALRETTRHNLALEGKTSPKGFGMINDDLGNFYQYNKDTGEYKLVQNAGQGQVPSKFIETKTITTRDGFGNEQTNIVPIDKRNGQPINPEQSTQGFKAPTLSQADRDSVGATTNALELLPQIQGQYRPELVGVFDNASSWAMNSLGINSKNTTDNRTLNATLQNLKANLTAALIKGVPSDRDMQVIEDMLPSTSDSEDVFQAKMTNIENILKTQQNSFKANILEPRNQGDLSQDVNTKSIPTSNKQKGSIYGADTEIISW